MIAVVLATGDPRAMLLLRWMTGATYRIDATTTAAAAGIAAVGLCAVPLLARPLELLALGNVAAQAAGLNVRGARRAIVSLVSVMTAALRYGRSPPGTVRSGRGAP